MAKLAIVGTGFVGASLGLALRPAKLFTSIAGYDRERSRLRTAQQVGAIDEEARNARDAVTGASVIVVAVSNEQLGDALQDVAAAAGPGALVTETSRWKVASQDLASRLLPRGVHFVGGRPVLDQREHGPGEARADVFRNAVYCLTPGKETNDAAINALSAMVSAAGSQPYFLDPTEHDALTAAGELLPSAVIASLVSALTSDPGWLDAGRLASDRFNRLALQAEELEAAFWREAADNSDALGRWLDATASALLEFRARLQSNAGDDLSKEWEATLQSVARWRREKRQLQESTMPSKAELRPNLLGNLGRLARGPSSAR